MGSSIAREAAGESSLLFRQLWDSPTGTFTYLLADPLSLEAVLIDPVFERHSRDLALINELGLLLMASIDTHVHADHVTGSWCLNAATGCSIALAAVAGADFVSQPLAHGDTIAFGRRSLSVRATPGHTNGCLTYVLDDASMAFTGDALLIRGCGRCDFQQGSAEALWNSINKQILSLPQHCLLYPGHDYEGRSVTSVAEESRFNPRFGGAVREQDFIGYMDNLQLPHPRRMDVALPGNLRSGRPLEESESKSDWAPLQRSYAGLDEITPDWVIRNLDVITLLDVRSNEEWLGPDGRVAGSLHLPLPDLMQSLEKLPRDRPVVVACYAGSRSALATQQLLQNGVKQVANLRGGLQRWADEGYPLELSK
tara:strand:+ start:595 stop:1698 length:1104 start_codon:yes stop_codon:yes gene_type:complete